ncbi:MAG: rpoE 4 [Segetibacter sp.]|nr:rpoE 4 [Segetibacter sp.]
MQYKKGQFIDEDLISMLKRKDENAFSYLYDKYGPLLYGVILKNVHDEKLASDILKKAFIKIWTECKSLDCVRQHLFAWLLSITNKTAMTDFKVNLQIKPDRSFSPTN